MATPMAIFAKSFEQQKDNDATLDVTFNISDADIKAHKCILSVRSPILKTIVNNPLSYVNGKIRISDSEMTYNDFKAFLKFLYTRECRFTRKNVETMFHLGNMYEVPEMLEKCSDFIDSILDIGNILYYSEIGLLYADRCLLISKCLEKIPIFCFPKKFIIDGKVFSPHISLMDASHNLMLKIVKDCKRNIYLTEDDLFKSLIDRAKQECTLKVIEAKGRNLKKVLKDFIPFIRFRNLKLFTLETIVKDIGLLSENELCQAMNKAKIRNGT